MGLVIPGETNSNILNIIQLNFKTRLREGKLNPMVTAKQTLKRFQHGPGMTAAVSLLGQNCCLHTGSGHASF